VVLVNGPFAKRGDDRLSFVVEHIRRNDARTHAHELPHVLRAHAPSGTGDEHDVSFERVLHGSDSF
jgi:hypothetical protein